MTLSEFQKIAVQIVPTEFLHNWHPCLPMYNLGVQPVMRYSILLHLSLNTLDLIIYLSWITGARVNEVELAISTGTSLAMGT